MQQPKGKRPTFKKFYAEGPIKRGPGQRGNRPRIDHDDKATMYGKPVKDMVPTVADLDKKYGKPDKKVNEYTSSPLDKLGASPYKVFNNRGNDGKDMPERKKQTSKEAYNRDVNRGIVHGTPWDHTKKVNEDDDGYKERGQRREGLSMLANVEKFLASEGDASSVAVVHKAIETMYMHVADIVEGMEDHEDKHFDGIDSEPSRSRETDQDRYGYQGDR